MKERNVLIKIGITIKKERRGNEKGWKEGNKKMEREIYRNEKNRSGNIKKEKNGKT